MSWFNKDTPEDNIDERMRNLEVELTRVLNENTELKAKVKAYEDATRSATFSFDFNAVKAFSVERNIGNGNMPVTIIGYLLPEPVVVTEGETTTKDVVREWYMYCDEKQHEALVKAFKDSRK